MKILPVIGATLCVLVLGACDGDATPFEEAVEVRSRNLQSISVVPPRMSVEKLFLNHGQAVQFGMQGRNASGETIELSASNREWGVSNTTLASIDANGRLVALADGDVGDVSVVVRMGGLQSAPFELTVQDSALLEIAEIKGESMVERCQPSDYQATGRHQDQTVRDLYAVSWDVAERDSDNARVVENDDGSVTLIGLNSSEVQLLAATSTLQPLSRSIEISDTLLGLSISPGLTSVKVDAFQDYAALGTYTSETMTPVEADTPTDGELTDEPEEPDDTTTTEGATATERLLDVTQSVIWSVDNTDVATISNSEGTRGRLTGVAAGSTVVNASCGLMIARQSVTVSGSTSTTDSTNTLSFDAGTQLVLSPNQSQVLRVSTGSPYNSTNRLDNDSLTWTFVNSGATSNAIVLETDGINAGTVRAVVATGEGTVTATRADGVSVSIVVTVRVN